ncbi:hypothetical protein GPX89_23665 [Nocardia sp. ET3-3]|uniref:Uncharacterized protein n=1 Tax=Nocardia terrae TaxID=2675851 RepID=A0A7K1V128_9NOCA|nr:hypothetical protein [Nocardia terrae]MVU80231.1 hypothetical protein [Nocardia terrae]
MLWLGLYAGSGVLLSHWFGMPAMVAFAVGALGQGLGTRAVRRRNQLTADRVSVDLGHGPGIRSYIDKRAPDDWLSPPMVWSLSPAMRVLAFLCRIIDPDPRPGERLLAIDRRLHLRWS